MSTTQFTIDVDKALHPELMAEMKKQSVYVSRDLKGLHFNDDGSVINIECNPGAEDELRATLDRFVSKMRIGFRESDVRIYWENRRTDNRGYESDVFQKLVDREWVLDLGPGQVALAGPALRLMHYIGRAIADIGRNQFGAVEREYPTLIPTQELVKCGYMDSFPQHLSLVSHLEENFDEIDEFRAANVSRKEFVPPKAANLSGSKVCLCPALCYHSYPTLQGRSLPSEGHMETSIGRIARYESTSMVGLERLWEFTQRSIIWLGEEDYCVERREQALQVAISLAKAWNIDCTIETANDPFFASVATAKNFWQRSQDLKLELRANVEPDEDSGARTVAAASFNLHGPFFGQAFDITDCRNEHAASGCASWGLERWVLVLFTQHGFRPENWPEVLRDEVFQDGQDGK